MMIVCSVIAICINGCDKTTGPTGPSLGNGLSSNRTTFSLRLFQEDTCSISGGTGRYVVSGKPDSTIVIYFFYDSKLTVVGFGAGFTSITISDDSNHTVTIPINIVAPAGKISFDATEGSFSVNGSPEALKTRSGEGCGAVHLQGNEKIQQISIIGYKFYSYFDAGKVFVELNDTAGVTRRTYTIGQNATAGYLLYGKAFSEPLSDTLTSGSVVISSITNETIKGTFSGSGKNVNTGQLISITNGSFDCPLFGVSVYFTTESVSPKNFFSNLNKLKK